MNRPMVWVAVGFLVGVALAANLSWMPLGAYAGLAVVGAGLGVYARTRWLGPAGVAMVFAGCGALTYGIQHAGPPWDPLCDLALEEPVDSFFRIEGTVRSADLYAGEDDGYMQAVVDVERVELRDTPQPTRGRLLLRWSDPGYGLFPGDRIRAMGKLETALSRVNFNAPGPEGAYRLRHVHTAMALSGPKAVEVVARAPVYYPRTGAAHFRAFLAKRLAAVVPAESLPFVYTVWLGDRHRLDNETYTRYLESGTAHILAVSDVHTAIVFVTIAGLLWMVVKSPRRRHLLLIGGILFFALMAGARTSSLRAAFMLSLYLVAELMDREGDPPTALSLSALLFTVFDTNAPFDTGFQLSFLSVASIMLYDSALSRRWRWFETPWGHSVGATLSVQVLTLPVAIGHFAVLPLCGPLVNLLVVPLLAVALWLCLLTSVTCLVLPPVAILFGHALHGCVWLIDLITRVAVALPFGHTYVAAPTALAVTAYGVGAVFLYAALRGTISGRIGALACGASLFLAFAFWTPLRQEASVTFLDVGHGDATVIVTPGGARMLVDGGNRVAQGDVQYDRGRDTVAPYLWRSHMARLDAVAVTHADSDHYGGLRYVLTHFPVGVFYTPTSILEIDGIRDLEDVCESRGIPVVRVSRGDTIPLAGAMCRVEHPSANWPQHTKDSVNEDSLVLRVSWPGMSALITADIEHEAEGALTRTVPKTAVMTMPHHGSQTSSSVSLIEAVGPSLAVASTGKRRGGPVFREFVADRYRERGIAVLRTDYLGGIRVTAGPDGPVAASSRVAVGFPYRGPAPPR